MITAWQVYVVMQADTIINASIILSIAFVAIGGVMYSAGKDENDRGACFFGKTLLCLSIATIATATFMPSTKTLATMLVVPALTSEESVDTIKAETRELYQIAKDALKELAEKDDKPAEKAK